jgi:hypothetical protein
MIRSGQTWVVPGYVAERDGVTRARNARSQRHSSEAGGAASGYSHTSPQWDSLGDGRALFGGGEGDVFWDLTTALVGERR